MGRSRSRKEMAAKRKRSDSPHNLGTDSCAGRVKARRRGESCSGLTRDDDLTSYRLASRGRRRSRLFTDADLRHEDVPHLAAQKANSRLENLSLLDVFSAPHVVRNTGIICTIGELTLRSPFFHACTKFIASCVIQ